MTMQEYVVALGEIAGISKQCSDTDGIKMSQVSLRCHDGVVWAPMLWVRGMEQAGVNLRQCPLTADDHASDNTYLGRTAGTLRANLLKSLGRCSCATQGVPGTGKSW